MMFRPGNIGHLGRLGLVAGMQPNLITQALAILAKYGPAANLYLPGVGAVNGITAGNWLDSAGTTPANVDGQVGRVDNARGGVNLTQSTAANRPVLRRGLVNQLRRSANFANTDQWFASNLSFASTVGPSGSNDATIITATNAASAALISSVTPPIATSEVVTLAYVVKATGENYSRTLLLRNSTTATNFQAGSFYCLNGQVAGAGWQSTAIGNGWFIVTFTQSTGISIGNSLFVYGGYVGGPPQGGVGSTFVVHRIGLFAGTVTAQQIVDAGGIPVTTTAPSSSTSGSFSWQLDGAGDRFDTAQTVGNAGWLCTVAKHTVAATAYAISGGGEFTGQPGACLRMAGGSTGPQLLVVGGGVLQAVQSSLVITPGTAFVYDGGWDASIRFVAVNGIETQLAKTVNCTGSSNIVVGSGQGGSLSTNGSIAATILMPAVLPTASERATLRRFIASLSGVTL